ncbi:terminase small subunit [Gordonia phage DumpsterDude]|uniref:Terminase small subunit n=1 Tax=Gordonia phage DumpsterDude TaxID=2713262 RepID=A0A6G8R055_9CAUD|nr:terminase small subunit [Gordonia phage DumpsterDude]QIN93589.1 terminase small subunit [Gordonia phage DumpsterDude]
MIIVDEFEASGATLWAELHDDTDDADLTVLVVEACRTVDRLDRLHSALRSGGLFDLVERGESVVEVRVDNALSEARQQGGALQRLLADIAKRRAAVPGDDEPDGLDDL